ncbi:cytochrome c biogenesis protein CcsA [Oligoflexus tunisiensis]|uniref:cytochrome c biogenesis protein CcsA n=1 Tax=Oligoflexus tunisiensis TaxID=708132 RepID=UPI000AE1BD94|nr:cytochrome c biogenesis protein CcsA [Oligoflexus tunisiensis]
MSNAVQQDRRSLLFGAGAAVLTLTAWIWALRFAPSEQHQGEVYRIVYLHVPAAFTAFLSAGLLMIFSLLTLFRRSANAALWAKATAEIGLLYTIITLATGSIWGRPTWGVWWEWDARLTTTLILALLYAGYLIFHSSMNPGPQRDRIAAALGVIIALDVPIIYQSVNWWRTLHQPQSIVRTGGSTMAPEMLSVLFFGFLASLVLASWLLILRFGNLRLQQLLEQYSYDAQAKGE